MAEKIDLTTPYVPDPRSAADFQVGRLVLDWTGQGLVITLVKGNVSRDIAYNGTEAVTLMVALNKANLATKSLQRRILEKLVTDGHIAGTISGAPD